MIFEFLKNYAPECFFSLIISNFIIFILLFIQFKNHKQKAALLLLINTVALIYDALVISLGNYITNADLLYYLSLFRFVMQGGLVPLFFIVSTEIAEINNLKWITPKFKNFILLLTIFISLFGTTAGFFNKIKQVDFIGITRYSSDKLLSPTWASIGVNLPAILSIYFIIIIGIFIFIKHKNFSVFLGALTMLLFTLLGKQYSFLTSSIGETILFFVLYTQLKLSSKKLVST